MPLIALVVKSVTPPTPTNILPRTPAVLFSPAFLNTELELFICLIPKPKALKLVLISSYLKAKKLPKGVYARSLKRGATML